MKFAIKTVAASLLLASATGAFAQKGETVKIAWLDPLSGLMAAVGTNQLKSFQFISEEFNKKNASGVKFEIIGIDNKLSPQETSSALRSAMDQGVRYVVQGNGSGPALAIIDALEKHNARNPGKEVVFLNYAAVDPDLTNSKCSYWHFRLDADTSMKMEALTTYIKDVPEVKKVYLINQNYSHGHQVSKFAKEMLKRKRPDIQIVGDDLSPLAQVRDFSPYIAKIKQSGADTVITGNWGSDLALLIKAANDAGLNNVNFYTYYGSVTGSPTAMGAAAAGRVYMVAYAHMNLPGELNKMPETGMWFGHPYYGGGEVRTNEYKDQEIPADLTARYVPPQVEMIAHAADLGMMFYTGSMFPQKYKNAIFSAQHGSWNATVPRGARVMVTFLDEEGNAAETMPFAEGWLQDSGVYSGRPVDVQQYVDGSLLVSDDKAGAVYRISYDNQ